MENTTENNKLIAEFMGGKLRGRYISFLDNKGLFPKLLRLEATYKAVIEFINWYNQQKQ